MIDNSENLQNEVNTILSPQIGSIPVEQNQQPNTISTPTSNFTNSSEITVEDITFPSNAVTAQPQTNAPQNIELPAIKPVQTSQIVPPIQSYSSYGYSSSYSNSHNEEKNQTNSFGKFIVIAVILSLLALGYVNRKSIFGIQTYSDCLEIEGSTKVDLEPKYCVTPDREIFFQNRSERIPQENKAIQENSGTQIPDVL